MLIERAVGEAWQVDPVVARRTALVNLVLVAEVYRSGPRPIRSWGQNAVLGACAQVGTAWTGRLDREWVLREFAEVRAQPGEYPAESYERWRLHGVPIWAVLAAGMTPTPGSRKLVGRRPKLP